MQQMRFPAIVKKLTNAGYRSVQAVKIVPSLEDVFIALIEERDRQEAVQREVAR
jgi:ABC-2 type transport system ATP-binding protein